MTNLINDTETTGRRLFEPVALALLAVGGVTASVARSDGGSDQPGLVVPPLTAQAHAAGSPVPEAATATSALTELAVPADEAEPLAAEPIRTKSFQASAPQGAISPNRFAEAFAEVGSAPASLALERPEPVVEVAVQTPTSATPALVIESAPLIAVVELVPEASAPAMQLVAAEPVPGAVITAAPVTAELAPTAPAFIQAPEAEPAAQQLAIAERSVPVSPSAIKAETVQLAVAPALAGVEAATRLDNEVLAPIADKPAEAAPASIEPAGLVPQPVPAAGAVGPVALAATETKAEPAKLAFVSEPVVQSVPVTAASKPIAAALAQPAPGAAVALVEPALRLTKTRTNAPRVARIGGAIVSNFQLTDGTIDYRIGARVNGGEPASLPLRITRDDQLSVKLGDLLSLVKPQMDPALYAYLAASRGAEEYLSFAAIRATGIDIRYDAARDQLLLGVE